ALILSVPAFAQQPEKPATGPAEHPEQVVQTPAKPETKTSETPAQPETKPEAKAAESPAPSTESWIKGNIDFGYRWVTDVGGNFQEYRSVVNLGEGPKLFGLDLSLQPKQHLFDSLNLRAYGWSGDPYKTAHLDARKSGAYDFTFDYRDIAYFNAVPSFANP